MSARRNVKQPPPQLLKWAYVLGDALGRGIARGMIAGLAASGMQVPGLKRPRGRPPKGLGIPVPASMRCQHEGCLRPSRSKGLCTAHYQAQRRRSQPAS